jgi:hypothetical protein
MAEVGGVAATAFSSAHGHFLHPRHQSQRDGTCNDADRRVGEHRHHCAEGVCVLRGRFDPVVRA